jgi:hypothetical protein
MEMNRENIQSGSPTSADQQPGMLRAEAKGIPNTSEAPMFEECSSADIVKRYIRNLGRCRKNKFGLYPLF